MMAPKIVAIIAGTKRIREASARWLAGGKAKWDEKSIGFGSAIWTYTLYFEFHGDFLF